MPKKAADYADECFLCAIDAFAKELGKWLKAGDCGRAWTRP